MKVKNVIATIEKNDKFKELSKKGYYISSIFVTLADFDEVPDRWHVHCFEPKSKEMATFLFSEKVEFESISHPLTEIEINELRAEKVSVDFAEAVGISKDSLEIPKENIVKVLITLHNLGNVAGATAEAWTVNVISKLFRIHSLTISAESGEVVSKIEESLIKTE